MPTSAPVVDAALEVFADLGVAPISCTEPVVRPGVIERPDVLDLLAQSVDTPVVVVSAPAGFGKTTAVRLWADSDARPFAWVHLGSVDDDPVHLIRHIAGAVHRCSPLDAQVVRVLTGSGRSVDTDLLPSLGHTISGCEPMVVVLEDGHLLTSDGALEVLQGLFPYLPAGSQLILVCRHVPGLHLARGRLDGDVVEIGHDDLVMTRVEAAALFAANGLDLDDVQVDELVDQTEGWPAGLGLAALALRCGPLRGGPPGARGARGRDRPITDYVMEEVLADLDEDTRVFLLRSSVLDRMTVPLLDELLDVEGSAGMLRRVEQMGNPFLVPLDDRGDWFRYHHLFGEALGHALERELPDEVRPLRARASCVLEASGDADGAVRLAVAAGDQGRAADIILRNALRLIDEGRSGLLGQWLGLLGPDAAEHSPSAAIAEAWYGISTGDPTRIARAIKAAEMLPSDGPLPDGSPSLTVAVAAVRSIVAAEGTAGVLRDNATIRAGGGPRTNPWWGYATCLDGSVATLVGDNESGRLLLTAGLAEVAHSPSFEAGFLGILALLEIYQDDLAAAERHAHRALRLCDQHNLEAVTLVIPAYAGAALLSARLGRPDEARRDALRSRRLLARLGDLSPRSALRGYVALAQAAAAIGDHADARALAREASDARRRDPTCTFLNEMLDDLELTLGHLTVSGPDTASISAAELRVLTYLPTHLSLREIAIALYLSRNTVKTHVVAIYRKLGVSSRAEAVEAARSLGLLDVPGPIPTAPAT